MFVNCRFKFHIFNVYLTFALSYLALPFLCFFLFCRQLSLNETRLSENDENDVTNVNAINSAISKDLNILQVVCSSAVAKDSNIPANIDKIVISSLKDGSVANCKEFDYYNSTENVGIENYHTNSTENSKLPDPNSDAIPGNTVMSTLRFPSWSNYNTLLIPSVTLEEKPVAPSQVSSPHSKETVLSNLTPKQKYPGHVSNSELAMMKLSAKTCQMANAIATDGLPFGVFLEKRLKKNFSLNGFCVQNGKNLNLIPELGFSEKISETPGPFCPDTDFHDFRLQFTQLPQACPTCWSSQRNRLGHHV